MKLHLANGTIYKDGWLNVDISPQVKTDKVVDLLKFPWPWEDDSAEEIYCSHFIEHIGDEFIPFMDECWRVLDLGGAATFRCPYYTSIRAWQDPTHKRAINEYLFSYFNKDWRKQNGLSHYDIKSDFKVGEIRYIMQADMKENTPEDIEWARQHCWNVVADIEVTLEAIK